MPNARLLSSIVTEIALIQFPFVVLKGPSNCRNHAVGPKGEVSGDELESSRQGSHMEAPQGAYEGDLRGRPDTWGEAVGPHTCGRRWRSIQLLGHSWRDSRGSYQGRPGMGHIQKELRAINFILAFQRHLSGRLQTRGIRDNGWPGSLHQADCQGVPMEEGNSRGANDRLAVPCHHLLRDM